MKVDDKLMARIFVILAALHMVQGFGEQFGLWGDVTKPHFSHGGIALMWFAIAYLFHRTRPSLNGQSKGPDSE